MRGTSLRSNFIIQAPLLPPFTLLASLASVPEPESLLYLSLTPPPSLLFRAPGRMSEGGGGGVREWGWGGHGVRARTGEGGAIVLSLAARARRWAMACLSRSVQRQRVGPRGRPQHCFAGALRRLQWGAYLAPGGRLEGYRRAKAGAESG